MYKDKYGNYQKNIFVDGKRICIRGKTEKEVKQNERDYFKNAKQIKENNANPKMTDYIEEWFEKHKQTIKANTIDCYVKPVADCKDWFSDYKVADIKPRDIEEFIQHLIDYKYSRQTINLRYIVLCKTFDMAIFNEIIISNPARAYKLPANLPKSKRDNLTPAQIKGIEKSENLFANILLYTGCRRNEALALTWEDIDFDKKRITINKQLLWEKDKKPQIINNTKSASGVRTVPLLKPLESLLTPLKSKGQIIPIMSEGAFQRYWNSVKADIGHNITPHQFRHAYITILHNAGIDVKTAQVLAGHSKITTTMDIYTHLDSSVSDNALDVLNAYFDK